MKIAVAAGGFSPERDVSLSSGALIAGALTQLGHSVAFVDTYAGSRLSPDQAFGTPLDGAFPVGESAPDLSEVKRRYHPHDDSQIGPGTLEICAKADIVFIALHGAAGENGQIQAAFDVAGIRYTGSGYTGCALAMDKDIAKRLMRVSGIPTADWIYFDAGKNASAKAIADGIGLPCVVKPCGCGSSCGVSLVKCGEELETALESAKAFGGGLLAEKLIDGREFSVGVVGDKGAAGHRDPPQTRFLRLQEQIPERHDRRDRPGAHLRRADRRGTGSGG
jgi:D-alanine-D-alanine ligase